MKLGFLLPRLQGTAALQIRNEHWSLDQGLEGVRSLGAVLDEGSFALAVTTHASNVGPLLVRRLQGTAALQVRNEHWSLDQDLEGVRSLGAVLDDGSFVLP